MNVGSQVYIATSPSNIPVEFMKPFIGFSRAPQLARAVEHNNRDMNFEGLDNNYHRLYMQDQ